MAGIYKTFEPITADPAQPFKQTTVAGALVNGFMLDTHIGQWFQRHEIDDLVGRHGPEDPSYNVFRDDRINLDEINPMIFDELMAAESYEDALAIQQMSARNAEREEYLEDHGIARFVSQFADPYNFIPVPMAMGRGFVQGFKRTLLPNLGIVAAAETGRTSLDPNDTIGQTALNISLGTLLASGIGGAFGMIPYRPEHITAKINAYNSVQEHLNTHPTPEGGPTMKDLEINETSIQRFKDAGAIDSKVTPEDLIRGSVDDGLPGNVMRFQRLRVGDEKFGQRLTITKDEKAGDFVLESGGQIIQRGAKKDLIDVAQDLGTKRVKSFTSREALNYGDTRFNELYPDAPDPVADPVAFKQYMDDHLPYESVVDGDGARVTPETGAFNRHTIREVMDADRLHMNDLIKEQETEIARLKAERSVAERGRGPDGKFVPRETTQAILDDIDVRLTRLESTRKRNIEYRDDVEERIQLTEESNDPADYMLKSTGIGLEKLYSKSQMFPWFRLTNPKLAEIAPDLAPSWQRIAYRLSASPGLMYRGGERGIGVGTSAEMQSVQWWNHFRIAKMATDSEYAKLYGYGDEIGPTQQMIMEGKESAVRFLGRKDRDIDATGGGMSFGDFRIQVSEAMINGGKVTKNQSELLDAKTISAIENSASHWRKFFDKFKHDAETLDVFQTQASVTRKINSLKRVLEQSEAELAEIDAGNLSAIPPFRSVDVEVRYQTITEDLKDPDPVTGEFAMAFRRTENGKDVIYMDREGLKRGFDRKAWLNSKTMRDGSKVTPLDVLAGLREPDKPTQKLNLVVSNDAKRNRQADADALAAKTDEMEIESNVDVNNPKIIEMAERFGLYNEFINPISSFPWSVRSRNAVTKYIYNKYLTTEDMIQADWLYKKTLKETKDSGGFLAEDDAQYAAVMFLQRKINERVPGGDIWKYHDELMKGLPKEMDFALSTYGVGDEATPDLKSVESTAPAKQDATAGESMFKSPAAWEQFVLAHEKAHVAHRIRKGESIADYENRTNQNALKELHELKNIPGLQKKLRDSKQRRIDELMLKLDQLEQTHDAMRGMTGEGDWLSPDYFYRVWQPDAIKADEANFKEILRAYFKENPYGWVYGKREKYSTRDVDIEVRVNEAYDNIIREAEHYDALMIDDPVVRQRQIEGRINELTEDLKKAQSALEIKTLERKIELYQGILARPDMPTNILPSPLRARQLDIPNSMVMKYINMDVEHVGQLYLQKMAPTIEIARNFGDRTLSEYRAPLNNALDERIIVERAYGNDALADALEKEKIELNESVDNLRDMVAGTYGMSKNPAHWTGRAVRLSMAWMNLVSMGKAVAVALNDFGNYVGYVGFKRAFGDTWRYTLARARRDASEWNLARDEVLAAGEAAQAMSSQRAIALTDIGGMSGFGKFERAVQKNQQRMFIANLLTPWTDFMEGLTGAAAQHAIIRDAVAMTNGTLSKSRMTELTKLGMTRTMARKISEQWHKIPEAERQGRHLFLANADKWDDPHAQRMFRAMLSTEIANLVPAPKAADKPTILSKDWARVMFQYKGFSFAATSKILMANLQRRDARALNTAVAMIGMSWLIDMKKRPDFIDMDLEDSLFRAVEISGVAGIFSDVNQAVEGVTGGEYGMRPMLGLQSMERDVSTQTRFGAVAGAVPNLATSFMSAFLSDDADTADQARAIRYMIPYNNLLYWSWAVDRLQRNVVGALE